MQQPTLEELKQQIAMHLTVKHSSASLDALLRRHGYRFHQSPLFDVFPLTESTNATEGGLVSAELSARLLLILYTVEGVLDDDGVGDSRIFVLDRSTKEDFRMHVALERPITFLLITRNAECDLAAGDAACRPPSTGTVPEDAVGDTSSSIIIMERFDLSPQAAAMSTYKGGVATLTRPTHAMARARDALDALERGSTRIDAEAALTDCCTWIHETLELLQETFVNLIRTSESAIQVLEAYMKRYTAVSQLLGVVSDPNGIFVQLDSKYVHAEGEAALRYRQRTSHLVLLVTEYRQEAMWASLLTTTALRIKFEVPYRDQSLAGLASLAPQLIRTLALVFAAAGAISATSSASSAAAGTLPDGTPASSVHSSRAFPLLRTLRQQFLPLTVWNLLHKVSGYVALDKMFSVECVADAAEQQGYLLPLCSRPAMLSKVENAGEFCIRVSFLIHYYGRALERLLPPPTFESFRTLPDAVVAAERDGDNSAEGVVTSQLHYASARCSDLIAMVRAVDAVGCGMMTREARCLYDTMHLAATSFPLLEGLHYKNWQVFADVFDKTKTLRLIAVEPVTYVAAEAQVANVGLSGGGDAGATSDVVRAPTDDETVDEEKRILRSRVTVLNSELVEARELLAKATEQLRDTQKGLSEAQELNVVLMREVRRMMMMSMSGTEGSSSSSPARKYSGILSSYDAMIHALATGNEPEE